LLLKKITVPSTINIFSSYRYIHLQKCTRIYFYK